MRYAFALAIGLAGCGVRPPAMPAPPAGELVLDADRPLIEVRVAGVALRLRVDPGQWDAIELNPDAAAKLAVPWAADRDLQIGRIELDGRTAQTILEVDGRKLPVLVAQHGRAAADDADGVVGPDILPFAAVRWRRPGAPAPNDSLALPLDLAGRTGLTAAAPALPVPVRLRFSLMRPTSEATAAAGSLLAQRFGARFEGPAEPLPVLFGISRPARPMRFDRPPALAGFRIARVMVRIADFRGDNPLPRDAVPDGEIVVAGKDHPQPALSWVTLARDRLGACVEITYRANPRTLILSCAFDR